uniref:Oxysterol binding protein like 7 n=1 Tax=Prolemur simus TaxID=1328070 RepID=A0A8C8YYG7_PROSS
MDFQERDSPSLAESAQSSKPSGAQQASELWEVVEEPRGRLAAEGITPERQEGHLLKKRKWPLKGWHKRYFVLEDGILYYATTRQDITKGKLHGSIDVRLSVMSINKKAQRIDLDTEDNIYHLKIKSQDLFHSWVAQLRAHRLAQRLDMPRSLLPSTMHRKVPGAQLPTVGSTSALPGVGPREKVSSWLRDSDGLDRCSHELSECQGKLQELHRLLQSLESLHRIPSAPVIPTHQASVTTERPKKGKRTSRMWCTQSFAKDDTIGRVGRLHGSVPNLSRYLESRDSSGPRGLPPTDYAHLQRSFWALAQKGECVAQLPQQRPGLRAIKDGGEVSEAPAGQRRLHSLSISSDTTADSFSSLNPEEQEALYMKGRELTPQLSQSSILSLADSHTEFFDACEVLLSASSSENEVREEG